MGVNVFVLYERKHYPLLADLEKLVTEINHEYGGNILFSWCDLFRGGKPGDWLLSITEAKNFEVGAEPYYILNKLNGHWEYSDYSEVGDGWRDELERYRLRGDVWVLFLKARN